MFTKDSLPPDQYNELEKLRQVLLKKANPGQNPLSKLNECCQRTGVLPTFNFIEHSTNPGQFACELDYAGIKILGFATQKKKAKTNSAEKMIKICLGEDNEDDDSSLRDIIETKTDTIKTASPITAAAVLNTPSSTATTNKSNIKPLKPENKKEAVKAPPAISDSEGRKPDVSNEATTSLKIDISPSKSTGAAICNREVWRECMLQLKHKEKDSVVLLAIFALNTGTGSPKYQITETLKSGTSVVVHKVMCTWNMFFMECMAETRLQAEQKSAFKMINNIRSICSLDQIPEKTPMDIETIDSSEIVNEEDIPEEIKILLIKNEEILRDKKTLKSHVKRLEVFSSKLACPVMPNYNITKVDTEGVCVVVEVECSWLTLMTKGVEGNRSKAEEVAADLMIKDILKIIGKMDRGSYDLPPPSVKKDSEPVRYLMYPNKTVSVINSVAVTSNDYLCLQTEQYLNDVIIDFYLKYLQVGRWPDNKMLQNTYIFSIYFYNRLTMKSNTNAAIPREQLMHNNVKKWTKKVNIFEKDFIVVPINECDHWFVVIICLVASSTSAKKPIMIVMDSLEDGLKNTVCSNLRTYLSLEWSAKMNTKREFTRENMPVFCPRIPQQTNLTDCGLFLLQYVESFYQDPLESLDIPLKSLENWFSSDAIVRKRHDIAKLIRTLASHDVGVKNFQYPDIDFGFEEPEETVCCLLPPVTIKADNTKLKRVEDGEKETVSTLSGIKRKNVEDDDDEDGKKLKEELDYLSSSDWLEDY